MLNELLKRGHRVDFFSKKSFVYPKALLAYPNLRYLDCPNPRVEAICQRAKSSGSLIRWALGRLDHQTSSSAVVRRMRSEHRRQPYDLQLFLGTWGFGRLCGIPTVSWVQGPPGTDCRSIVKHRSLIKRLCGYKEYLKLNLYRYYRASIGRPPFKLSDVVICGSQWSRSAIAAHGVNKRQIHALPYPIDLNAFDFRPNERLTSDKLITVLWLGRIVPRKRLDLFLYACARLIKSGQALRVQVIGGMPFAAGYRSLIDLFPYPQHLTYAPRIDRDKVPDLLRTADLVVQPSEEEDFGSTIAEALACGTPVVVGPTNGLRDYIGECGVVFDHYDADSLANAMLRMFDRIRDGQEQLAVACRATAVQRFHVQAIVEKLERILASSIETPPPNDLH
jgi:glycosyltransferase involved in cell wall biosynthesis